MSDRIFPIHNDAACVYKWSWNTFRLHSATSSSCHRVNPVVVPLDNFDDFHNTPEVLEDRKKMLSGVWPGRGCEYCQNVEKHGGISDRLYHNTMPGLTPVDFDLNGDNRVTPRIVEIYLSNTCDMACVYCSPYFSSKINQELKKYGAYPIGFKPVDEIVANSDQYFSAWLAWLEKNYQKINRLSILGGEPLLQKELWKILDFVSTQSNRDLVVAINTNLNSSPDIVQKFVEKTKSLIANKNIKRVDINASLDCWGPQSAFIRYGVDLNRWQKNFEYLIEHKWLNITVHQVITSLSIDTTIDLQNKIAEYKKKNPKIHQAYHQVASGYERIYHPEIFGAEFFKSQLDELVETYPITTVWDLESRKRLEGIRKLQQQSTPDLLRLKELYATLDAIDYRRNTQWRKLFPRIDQYFKDNNVV